MCDERKTSPYPPGRIAGGYLSTEGEADNQSYRGKQWTPLDTTMGAAQVAADHPSPVDNMISTPGNRTLDTLHKLRFQAERHLRDVTRAIEIATANPQILDNIEFEDIMRRLGMR